MKLGFGASGSFSNIVDGLECTYFTAEPDLIY